MGYAVYMHINRKNQKRYIGITSRKPQTRWGCDGKGYQQNKHFWNSIQKNGWDGFDHIVVAEGLTKEVACQWEEALIATFRSNDRLFGYNGSEGGEKPARGARHTDEWKKEQGEIMTGREKTPEECRRISEAKKGRPNGLKGLIGEKCTHAGIVYQIEEKTGKVIATYNGYDEMYRITGFARTPVKETVSGKRKRAYGFKWRYEKRN